MAGGRQPSAEYNLRSKTTLRWKTTSSGRLPSVEDDLQWKTTFRGSLHATYSALWHFFFITESGT